MGGGCPDHLSPSGSAHRLEISNCPLPRHGLSFVGANSKSHKCFPCEHLKFQKIVVPGRVASDMRGNCLFVYFRVAGDAYSIETHRTCDF